MDIMPFVNNNGVKIHNFSQGKGIPLVYLSGFDGTIKKSIEYDKDLITRVSERFQFVMFDRWGLGLSDKQISQRESEGNIVD